LARRLALVLLCLTLLAPSAASAAVTIGNNLAATPGGGVTSTCGMPVDCSSTFLLTQLPPAAIASGGLAAPAGGVVVRFRIKTTLSGDPTSSARLRLAFDAGGGAYVGDGTGTAVTIANVSGVQTFPERLAIKAGDRIGIEAVDTGATGTTVAPAMFRSTVGATNLQWFNPRLADASAARAPGATNSDDELLINADIEADADGDGFGDETQDACPSNSSTQGACPAGGGGGGGTPPPDRTAPVASLTARNSYPLKRTLRTGLTIRVSANEAGIANGTATYSGKLAASTTVASGSATFAKSGRVKLKLTFTKKARKSLARKKKARLTLKVVVTDRSGNPTTTTKKILLKR
jgi:hypothetical protein